MEDTNNIYSQTPTEAQIEGAPTPTAAPPPKTKFPKIVLVPLVIAGVGVLAIFIIGSLRRPAPTNTQAPALPQAATPTPERALSPVATQSAFIALEAHVASLSAGVTNLVWEDPSLSPPVLELPLGF